MRSSTCLIPPRFPGQPVQAVSQGHNDGQMRSDGQAGGDRVVRPVGRRVALNDPESRGSDGGQEEQRGHEQAVAGPLPVADQPASDRVQGESSSGGVSEGLGVSSGAGFSSGFEGVVSVSAAGCGLVSGVSGSGVSVEVGKAARAISTMGAR